MGSVCVKKPKNMKKESIVGPLVMLISGLALLIVSFWDLNVSAPHPEVNSIRMARETVSFSLYLIYFGFLAGLFFALFGVKMLICNIKNKLGFRTVK